MSLWGQFADALERHARRPLVTVGGETYVGVDLQRRAEALDVSLRQEIGLRTGDVCAFYLDNSIELVDGYLACARGGIVAAPMPTREGYVEVDRYLADVGARVLVVQADLLDRLPTIPDGVRVIVTGKAAAGKSLAYEGLMDTSSEALAPAAVNSNDVFCLAMTGGSTGTPKVSLQTHRNWEIASPATADRWMLSPEDRHLLVLPMCHVAWFTLAAHVLAGAHTYIQTSWNPVEALRTSRSMEVTTWNFVPTMLADLNDAAQSEAAPTSLRLIDLAGSRVSPAVYEEGCRIFGPNFGMAYGMTETAGAVSLLLPDEVARGHSIIGGCVGRPLDGTDVAILDDDGTPRGHDTEGEIVIRGDVVSRGYILLTGQGGASGAAPVRGDDGYRTGDLGLMDKDGFLYVTGRKKEMIKSGGYNVYPAEVESVLATHPAVREVVVFGINDRRWVEAVAAAVVVEGTCTEEELKEYCRTRLPGFKAPKFVEIVDEIPRTPVGKADVGRLAKSITASAVS